MLMADTPLIIAYNNRITLYSSSLFRSYTRFNYFITTTPLVSRRTPPPLIDDQPQQSSSRTSLQKMVNALITYNGALTVIGTLPTMAPRPNVTNIHAVDCHLYEQLSTTPSFKSTTFGYAGMTKKAELYALDTTTPWADFENPGPVREGTDGSLDAGPQRDQQAIYDGRVSIYTLQLNVKRAITTELNERVPKNANVSTEALEK